MLMWQNKHLIWWINTDKWCGVEASVQYEHPSDSLSVVNEHLSTELTLNMVDQHLITDSSVINEHLQFVYGLELNSVVGWHLKHLNWGINPFRRSLEHGVEVK